MNYNTPKVYAAKHIDGNIIQSSRSGGVFTALSDIILSQGGVIYGCVLTENFTAKHIRAEKHEERNLMRGSKYLQSDLGDTFKQAKEDLDSGRKVLFSGTSCQIAGLKGFLGKEYENLLCLDIVCHGVPSKKVWESLIKWVEKKNNSKVIEVYFRNKKEFGWRAHIETFRFDNERTKDSKIFKTLFYNHAILRPCCYKCPFKTVLHPGDITIADYWGIEKAAPDLDDNKGVSLVLLNNDKGDMYFKQAKKQLVWKETRLEDSLQPPLIAPFPKPENRERFWKDFENCSFELIARKYGDYGIINDIKNRIHRLKKNMKKMVKMK